MADLTFGGGLNETDQDEIEIGETQDGFNFVMDTGRENFNPRGPQDLVGTADNGKPVRGIMQMVARSGTITTLVKAGEVIYSWDGSSFTSERSADITTSSRMRSSYWSLDDILVITDMDKNDPVLKWNGTSVLRLKTSLVAGSPAAVTQLAFSGGTATATHSTHGFSSGDLVTVAGASEAEYNGEHEITVTGANAYTYSVTGSPATPITTSITADLGVELKAKYSLVKDSRMWLFNVDTDATELPHAILVSTFEDPENFDTAVRGKAQDASSAATGSDPFFLLTPDLRPINGATLFLNNIVISTEGGRLYRLTGSDPTDYNFVDYYSGSASGFNESMINIGNDVMYVKVGGDIDKLTDTERSGDVAVDDPSHFIPKTRRMLENPLAVYDQTNQRALWFEQGFVLVYDKGSAVLNPNLSPWSKWTTLMPNAFQTEAAVYMRRPGKTTSSVYWGDQEGNLYDFNGEGFEGDAGTYDIHSRRAFRYITELPTNFKLLEGRVMYQRIGRCTLEITLDWGEEYNQTTCDIPLKGPVITGGPNFWSEKDLYWGEDEYWNEGNIAGDDEVALNSATAGFSAVGRSPGFTLTMDITTKAKFSIHKMTI